MFQVQTFQHEDGGAAFFYFYSSLEYIMIEIMPFC